MKAIIVGLSIALSMNAAAEPEIKGKPSEMAEYLNSIPAKVDIKVKSEKTIKADEALVHFVISSKEDTLKEALEENKNILSTLKKKLKALGITGEAIGSKAYSTLPSYSFYSKKPTSYKASKQISLKVKSEAELIQVLSVMELHENCRFLNVEYKYSKIDETRQELLEENLQKAKKRKELYEKSLEVKLKVHSFVNNPVTQAGLYMKLDNVGYTEKGKYNSAAIYNSQGREASDGSSGFAEYTISNSLRVLYLVQ